MYILGVDFSHEYSSCSLKAYSLLLLIAIHENVNQSAHLSSQREIVKYLMSQLQLG